ncbi:uncharacterized protein SPSC_03447 [Sporisorium scitamineum]|uniref:Uncharacterized protein n=1 Tax=Sporisorium scitamineum TaxID=49012 RepID=A0A140KMV6_9BASI|nr:uncharacterized protein SPSC_03447 [Sporisorium scitamineum]
MSSTSASTPASEVTLHSYTFQGSEIKVKQRARAYQQQRDINDQMLKQVGITMPALSFSIPPWERRFLPSSLMLSNTTEADLSRVYDQFQAILGPSAQKHLPRVRVFPDIPKIENEACLVGFWRERALNDIVTMLQAALKRVAHLETIQDRLSTQDRDALASPLARALAKVDFFNIVHQRDTKLASTPASDDINSNLPTLFQLLRDHPALTRLFSPLPNKLKQENYLRPQPDMEIVYELKDPDVSPDHTCLVLELKSPIDITYQDVVNAVKLLQEYRLNPALLREVQADNNIPLCRLLMLHAHQLSHSAKYVLSTIVQHYHSVINRLQTFGYLSFGVASVSLEVDWDHPTEPGQHVKCCLFQDAPFSAEPRWHDAQRPPYPTYVMLCLTLLQLVKGPVQDDKVQSFLDGYFDGDENDDDQAHGGGLGDDTQDDSAADPDFRPPPSEDGQDGQDDTRDAQAPKKRRRSSRKHSRQRANQSTRQASGSSDSSATIPTSGASSATPTSVKPRKPRTNSTRASTSTNLDPCKLCRFAEPAELVVNAAELIQQEVQGKQVDASEVRKLLARPLIDGLVPTQFNLRKAIAEELHSIDSDASLAIKRRHSGQDDDDDAADGHLKRPGQLGSLVSRMATSSTATPITDASIAYLDGEQGLQEDTGPTSSQTACSPRRNKKRKRLSDGSETASLTTSSAKSVPELPVSRSSTPASSVADQDVPPAGMLPPRMNQRAADIESSKQGIRPFPYSSAMPLPTPSPSP